MTMAALPEADTCCKLLEDSFTKVFRTMLRCPVAFDQSLQPERNEDNPFYRLGAADPLLVGSVGFTGALEGALYQYLHCDLGLVLSSLMTQLPIPEIRAEGEVEIVNDVIGELTNMTCGTFKNALCDQGWPCLLTLPTVLRGSQMRVNCIKAATRYTFVFKVAGQPVVTDLFLEPGQEAKTL